MAFNDFSAIPDSVKQVVKGAHQIDLGVKFYKVPSDYYEWSLEQRMQVLEAPSTSHLCKTVIFANTKWDPQLKVPFDRRNAKFYCLIVQYIDRLHSQKLNNFVKSLGANSEVERSKKYFNIRVCDEQLATELTGYQKGGVSPLGMLADIPIIVTKNIAELDPPVVYLGAGHNDFKVSFNINEFRVKTNCLVADLAYEQQ